MPAFHINHGDFVAAHPSAVLTRLTWRLLRYILRSRKVLRVEISNEDIKRLRALRRERVVLCPNHPTNTDPALLVELSRRARMPFYFLCCREAFDGWCGLWGWIIQRLGAFSVVRGTIDRESFRYTRDLLAHPATKLVLFPEGEVYSQNDSLLPFQVGAVQLALWGQEDAREKEAGARVLLLPVALRYRFAEDVLPELHNKLSRLEEKLGIGETASIASSLELESQYSRMRRIAKRVLSAVEKEYALAPLESDDLTPRFLAAKEAALSRAAELLQEKMPRGTVPERMRVLMHRAESRMHETGGDEVGEKPENREHLQKAWRDLERLANWVAIYDGYASENLSVERLAEVVYRLERHILGTATDAGARIACLKLGAPIKLPDDIPRRELAEWSHKLEDAVRELL